MGDDTVVLGMAGGSADDYVIRTDLRLRPPSGVFNASIPRNLNNQIHWVSSSTQQVVTTSTTAITESNYAFNASGSLTQYTAWLAVFDQYYLAAVTCTIANNSPEGGTAACPQVYTALDFDSTTSLSSLAAISAYVNCNVVTLAPGKSVTRLLRPCNSSYTGANSGAGVSRTWVDSAYNSTLFYGFRSIVNNTVVATVQLDYTFHSVWAFRNTI
jgi:hypothetical protein